MLFNLFVVCMGIQTSLCVGVAYVGCNKLQCTKDFSKKHVRDVDFGQNITSLVGMPGKRRFMFLWFGAIMVLTNWAHITFDARDNGTT